MRRVFLCEELARWSSWMTRSDDELGLGLMFAWLVLAVERSFWKSLVNKVGEEEER